MGEPRRSFDAIVVGSGFGGSISALRLAQAGRSVVVLERGRRYGPDDMPRDVRAVDRLLWDARHPDRGAGLFDVRFFSALGVVVAAGVGGGSLVYANIHIRPDAVVFDDPRWPAGTDRASLDPYYDKVAEAFGVAPVPESVPLAKRDAFRQAGQRLHRESFDPDQAVTWPTGPDDQGPGVCRMVAECEFGCRYGAKRTVDRLHLAQAEQLGAEVRSGTLVVGLESAPSGWSVRCRDLATGALTTLTARQVVLAAGTLGTNELLLRCRDQLHTLSGLSPRLGFGFSANGDFLGSVQGATADLDPARGPDVTTVLRYFDQAPEFTMAAPTFAAPVMELLASLGQPDPRWLRPISGPLWRALPWVLPWAFKHGLLSRPSRLPAPHKGDWRHCTNLFAIGRDDAGGQLVLGRRGLDVRWRYRQANAALIARMEQAMVEVGEAYGGHAAPVATWNLFRRIITVHPLGGCSLAERPGDGVVSPHGEVHGCPGLFVADGSVVPTAIGFHPVMTISALAERTAEAVVGA
ncbi:MAG: GMC family oxidoreductase [Acidimicrobiales bacterium]